MTSLQSRIKDPSLYIANISKFIQNIHPGSSWPPIRKQASSVTAYSVIISPAANVSLGFALMCANFINQIRVQTSFPISHLSQSKEERWESQSELLSLSGRACLPACMCACVPGRPWAKHPRWYFRNPKNHLKVEGSSFSSLLHHREGRGKERRVRKRVTQLERI